jgi:hypothetical protein
MLIHILKIYQILKKILNMSKRQFVKKKITYDKTIFCKHGHKIKQENKCPNCVTEKNIMRVINKIANEKGGICVYDKTKNINMSSKQILVCKNDHMWVQQLLYIKKGCWCKKCSQKKKYLTIAHEIAKNKNGQCLSEEYINASSHLLWKCYLGHEWYASLNNVKNNETWCPKCNLNTGEEITRNIFEILFNEKFIKIKPKWLNGLELDGYCEKNHTGFEYDGSQHFMFSKHFHKTEEDFQHRKKLDKLKNELCEQNNITLLRIPYYVKYDNIKDYIINLCKEKKIVVPNNVEINYKEFKDIYKPNEAKLQKLKEIIENKGGTLLTDVYINNTAKIKIKCNKNHTWSTPANNIKTGNWCPFCAQNIKHTLKKMQLLAKEKNGKCLSEKYINTDTKLSWVCEFGHQWMATPSSILHGSWCPFCFNKKKYKHTIEEMQILAKEKGGKCLSEIYINTCTKLSWECKFGHQWMTIPSCILKKSWCPKCPRKKRNLMQNN